MNPITQSIRAFQYNSATNSSLPEVAAKDFGCCKLDEEFNAAAADLLLSSDAPQFENLADALATFCSEMFQNSSDNSYANAADAFRQAAAALHSRKGN